MAKKLIGLGAVTALMFSTSASADSLWHTFTTSTDGGTKYLVSAEGNLRGMESPTGYNHIGDNEGYVLCYTPPNLPEILALDLAGIGSGGATNFGAASASVGSPWTVTRNTSDGRLKFTQVFTFNATSKSLNIVMTLKNLTGSTINNVVLNRVAALRIDLGFVDPRDNWFAPTNDAVSGWNDPTFFGVNAHGLVLRHLKQSSGGAHFGLIPNNGRDCHTSGIYGPEHGGPADGLMHYFYPSIAAGASKSITIQYMRD